MVCPGLHERTTWAVFKTTFFPDLRRSEQPVNGLDRKRHKEVGFQGITSRLNGFNPNLRGKISAMSRYLAVHVRGALSDTNQYLFACLLMQGCV